LKASRTLSSPSASVSAVQQLPSLSQEELRLIETMQAEQSRTLEEQVEVIKRLESRLAKRTGV
jgi:hypothetical protein